MASKRPQPKPAGRGKGGAHDSSHGPRRVVGLVLKRVQAGTEGNWGATETISFTVKPSDTLNPSATRKPPAGVALPTPS